MAEDTSADAMDLRLHADRLAAPRARRTYEERGSGSARRRVRAADGAAWLLHGGVLKEWTPAGYARRRAMEHAPITVITPRSLVEVIRAGYQPAIHPTAS